MLGMSSAPAYGVAGQRADVVGVRMREDHVPNVVVRRAERRQRGADLVDAAGRTGVDDGRLVPPHQDVRRHGPECRLCPAKTIRIGRFVGHERAGLSGRLARRFTRRGIRRLDVGGVVARARSHDTAEHSDRERVPTEVGQELTSSHSVHAPDQRGPGEPERGVTASVDLTDVMAMVMVMIVWCR